MGGAPPRTPRAARNNLPSSWGDGEDDSPVAETLEKAKDMINKLRVDIDMESTFCPGVRRGYVIVPHKPRPNETGGAAAGKTPAGPPLASHRQHRHGEEGQWTNAFSLDADEPVAGEETPSPVGRQSQATHPVDHGGRRMDLKSNGRQERYGCMRPEYAQ
eukprot:s534_g10.t1